MTRPGDTISASPGGHSGEGPIPTMPGETEILGMMDIRHQTSQAIRYRQPLRRNEQQQLSGGPFPRSHPSSKRPEYCYFAEISNRRIGFNHLTSSTKDAAETLP
jgi:hypothetical protein